MIQKGTKSSFSSRLETKDIIKNTCLVDSHVQYLHVDVYIFIINNGLEHRVNCGSRSTSC